MIHVAPRSAVPAAPTSWTFVCALGEILRGTGVCALVAGRQIAVFRLADDRVYALDSRDPYSGANVLARGRIGERGGVATVTSPTHPRSFALASGVCLDDRRVVVPSYVVRVRAGMIEIAVSAARP
ncbi:MAG: nitrite reductase small subunit NirD [Deltaproteobacteria bacterium]|nr:nitrite reductase small subunit NirD [Deltaproteobacteria bacterium]